MGRILVAVFYNKLVRDVVSASAPNEWLRFDCSLLPLTGPDTPCVARPSSTKLLMCKQRGDADHEDNENAAARHADHPEQNCADLVRVQVKSAAAITTIVTASPAVVAFAVSHRCGTLSDRTLLSRGNKEEG